NTLKADSSYFNPTLWQNGEMVKTKGYCSDVFTDAAIDFVENNKEQPFFLYLAFNAPHAPLQVPQKYYNLYKDIDPAKGFENDIRPFPEMDEKSKSAARKVYAMVSNIDENMGKLLNKLNELELEQNTLVIFMTDNGPVPYRYLAGMRGRKSLVFQGGVRVPCFWRYPREFKGNRDIFTPASHYDILPTLAELCGGKIPADRKIDGKSLLPLLKNRKSVFSDRSLCRSWMRGLPEKYNNVSIRKGNYKLVGNCEEAATIEQFELFNIAKDPYELNNIVESNNNKALALKTEMGRWLDEMVASPNIVNPPRVVIGTRFENPSILNLNDVVVLKNKQLKSNSASWKIEIANSGSYDILFHFRQKITADCQIQINLGAFEHNVHFERPHSDVLKVENIQLPAVKADLITSLLLIGENKNTYITPFYVEVRRRS
ncbi:MAG: sulfatase-like hydrolase/transferase, partial [Candidatus Theseobacter exili]|nr:sulfatase-like hydrolase/transferase [Candidatus Theseobacter exili]